METGREIAMPGWNSYAALVEISDALLDSGLGLEELRQNKVRKETQGGSLGLDDSLLVVTSEFSSWGFDDLGAFCRYPEVSITCHEIVRELDAEHRWPHRPGTRVGDGE